MLSKGRIMQGIEFLETAKVDLGAMGIRTSLPMLDRHSPSAMPKCSMSIGICLRTEVRRRMPENFKRMSTSSKGQHCAEK